MGALAKTNCRPWFGPFHKAINPNIMNRTEIWRKPAKLCPSQFHQLLFAALVSAPSEYRPNFRSEKRSLSRSVDDLCRWTIVRSSSIVWNWSNRYIEVFFVPIGQLFHLFGCDNYLVVEKSKSAPENDKYCFPLFCSTFGISLMLNSTLSANNWIYNECYWRRTDGIRILT